MSRSSSSSRLFWKRRNFFRRWYNGCFVSCFVGRETTTMTTKTTMSQPARSRRTFVRGSKRTTTTQQQRKRKRRETNTREGKTHVNALETRTDRARIQTPFFLFNGRFSNLFSFRCGFCKNITRTTDRCVKTVFFPVNTFVFRRYPGCHSFRAFEGTRESNQHAAGNAKIFTKMSSTRECEKPRS